MHFNVIFGDKYDYKMKTKEGELVKWAMRVITKEFQGGADCDSSFFRTEFKIADDYYQERYASTFLPLFLLLVYMSIFYIGAKY